MIGYLVSTVGKLIEGVGSVVGYRGGTEEPAYRSEKLNRAVEIRHYQARTSAQTAVAADEVPARSIGFRRLAGYIFGGNKVGQKIAMTAPVAQESIGDKEWLIRFFMPAGMTTDSLPEPKDSQVTFAEVPEETIAVHRFSGNATSRAIAVHTEILLNTLRDFGFETIGAPVTWFYDPPWTLPALRRNEIAVQVRPTP